MAWRGGAEDQHRELVNRNLLEFHGSRPIRYSLTATARAEFLQ